MLSFLSFPYLIEEWDSLSPRNPLPHSVFPHDPEIIFLPYEP